MHLLSIIMRLGEPEYDRGFNGFGSHYGCDVEDDITRTVKVEGLSFNRRLDVTDFSDRLSDTDHYFDWYILKAHVGQAFDMIHLHVTWAILYILPIGFR